MNGFCVSTSSGIEGLRQHLLRTQTFLKTNSHEVFKHGYLNLISSRKEKPLLPICCNHV